MKRILILSFYYTPDLCAGSFRATALIEALQPLAKSHNYHIDLITTMPNRYHHFIVAAKEREELDHLSIYRIPLPSHKSGFIDQARAFKHYFVETKKQIKHKKYDCVFATSSRLFTAFLGALVSRKKKSPLFLDMRDIFTDTMDSILPFYLKLFFLPIFKTVERYTLKRASVLNLVSPGFTDYFSAKINPSCRVLQISNGVDDCFKNVMGYENTNGNNVINKVNDTMLCGNTNDNNVTNQTNDTIHCGDARGGLYSIRNKRSAIQVLYAGNIGSGQGIEKIIPSLANYFQKKYAATLANGSAHASERVNFRIIGSGGKLNALTKACGKLSNVEIIPPMSRTELIKEYQEADILFLHLNDYAAFKRVLPSKIFEYAMLGKPILAGVAGYSAQFLQQHIPWASTFQPCNDLAAIEKLKLIIAQNDTVSNKLIENFYQQFNRKILMKKLATEMLSI